jgi:enoyl-CoA hydratase
MSVRFEMRGHTALLTLEDPDRRNALSRAIVREALESLGRAKAQGARGIVIAGQGKAFCSGANMDDLRDGWMDGDEQDTDPVRLFRALVESPIPVTAAVHGAALGGGFELTMCCDLVVAGEDAWFALPELGVGVIPNTAMAMLPHLVGARKTLELVLKRDKLSAVAAMALGLVNQVVPAGTEVEAALAITQGIYGGATPSALAVAKKALRSHNPIDWELVRSTLNEVDRAEWNEGLSAFTARQPFNHEKFWQNNNNERGA